MGSRRQREAVDRLKHAMMCASRGSASSGSSEAQDRPRRSRTTHQTDPPAEIVPLTEIGADEEAFMVDIASAESRSAAKSQHMGQASRSQSLFVALSGAAITGLFVLVAILQIIGSSSALPPPQSSPAWPPPVPLSIVAQESAHATPLSPPPPPPSPFPPEPSPPPPPWPPPPLPSPPSRPERPPPYAPPPAAPPPSPPLPPFGDVVAGINRRFQFGGVHAVVARMIHALPPIQHSR